MTRAGRAARWGLREAAIAVAAALAAGLVACSGGDGGGGPAEEEEPAGPVLTPPATLGPGLTRVGGALDGAAGPVVSLGTWAEGRSGAVTSGHFVDLDGDGLDEVLVTTHGMPAELANAVLGFDAAGDLAPREDLPLPPGHVYAAVDLDGDGHLDLAIANPELPGSVLWGDGAGGFEAAPGAPTLWDMGLEYGGDVGFGLGDVDRDGLLDFIGGRSSGAVVNLNRGDRTFDLRSDLFGDLALAADCAIMVGEIEPGRTVILGLGATEAPGTAVSFVREEGLDADGYPHFFAFPALPPTLVGTSDPPSPASLSPNAPMGAALGDVDGDGLPDLAVTVNPGHLLLSFTGTWPLVDRSDRTGFSWVPKSNGYAQIPWGTALLDLDRDGHLDVVTVHGADNGPTVDEVTWPPQVLQHVTAHWNGGDFAFADVTGLAGLGRLGQWRALHFGDPDRDGDVDLVVGGHGEVPQVYRNDVVAGHGGVPRQTASVRLRGTTSNALGFGARLVADAPGGGRQSFHVGATAMPAQAAPALGFLTETDGGVVRAVVVEWPSGYVQEVGDLAAGRLHAIEEPELVRLDPPSRHAPADGAAQVTVRVTPRTRGGAPDPSAEVNIEAAFGHAGFTGPATRAADATERVLIAPTSPGSTVVEVRINGEPLRVRPRIWWD